MMMVNGSFDFDTKFGTGRKWIRVCGGRIWGSEDELVGRKKN